MVKIKTSYLKMASSELQNFLKVGVVQSFHQGRDVDKAVNEWKRFMESSIRALASSGCTFCKEPNLKPREQLQIAGNEIPSYNSV